MTWKRWAVDCTVFVEADSEEEAAEVVQRVLDEEFSYGEVLLVVEDAD